VQPVLHRAGVLLSGARYLFRRLSRRRAAEAAGVRTPRFWFELLRSPHRNRYRRAIAELPRWNLRAE
jgi:hypothetical protein